MKKFITLITAIILVSTLTSCGRGNTEENGVTILAEQSTIPGYALVSIAEGDVLSENFSEFDRTMICLVPDHEYIRIRDELYNTTVSFDDVAKAYGRYEIELTCIEEWNALRSSFFFFFTRIFLFSRFF